MKSLNLPNDALAHSLTPLEFLAKYPNLTYQDLANLLGCSLDTVKRWNNESRIPPKYLGRYLYSIASQFEQWKQNTPEHDNSIIYLIWAEKIAT